MNSSRTGPKDSAPSATADGVWVAKGMSVPEGGSTESVIPKTVFASWSPYRYADSPTGSFADTLIHFGGPAQTAFHPRARESHRDPARVGKTKGPVRQPSRWLPALCRELHATHKPGTTRCCRETAYSRLGKVVFLSQSRLNRPSRAINSSFRNRPASSSSTCGSGSPVCPLPAITP